MKKKIIKTFLKKNNLLKFSSVKANFFNMRFDTSTTICNITIISSMLMTFILRFLLIKIIHLIIQLSKLKNRKKKIEIISSFFKI